MKRWVFLIVATLATGACMPPGPHNTGVYLLVDTSGSYNRQMSKAEQITLYALSQEKKEKEVKEE